MKTFPKYMYRSDDGERFTLQKNNRYTMDFSVMEPKMEYTHDCLLSYGFVDSLDKCQIVPVKPMKNDGHGNYYYKD